MLCAIGFYMYCRRRNTIDCLHLHLLLDSFPCDSWYLCPVINTNDCVGYLLGPSSCGCCSAHGWTTPCFAWCAPQVARSACGPSGAVKLACMPRLYHPPACMRDDFLARSDTVQQWSRFSVFDCVLKSRSRNDVTPSWRHFPTGRQSIHHQLSSSSTSSRAMLSRVCALLLCTVRIYSRGVQERI